MLVDGAWTAVRSDSHPSTTYQWVRDDTVRTLPFSLVPRPRFSTRRYDALFVRVETELPDTKTAKPKPHPLRLITDALKSDIALKDTQ